MDWKHQRWLVRVGPTALFILTLGAAWWLHGPFDGPGVVIGFAQGEEVSIASMDAGRVRSIAVEPGQGVTTGQVIVLLDNEPIEAEIGIAEAELAQLDAEIAAGRLEVQRTMRQDTDKRQTAVEGLELELERERGAQQRAQAELSALRKERGRLKKLLKAKLATSDDLATIDVRYRTLQREAKARPRAIALLESQLNMAKIRAENGEFTEVDVMVLPLKQQRGVVQKRLDRLWAQRERLSLRASTDGRVVTVHRRAGEVVASGDPIVSLVSYMSGRIVACLSEQDALTVAENDRAVMQARGVSGPELQGRVVALGPLVDEVPVRCRVNPVQPSWGRNVVIQLDDAADIVPGQAFNVRFVSGRFSATGEALASQLARAGEPQEIGVPEKLRSASRLEPSGLTWVKGLNRYLMVSDDTGHSDKGDKAPWLFTMTRHGVMDPDPRIVSAIGEFNDLEGIAERPDGRFFLMSSQSYSRKGNRPASRTAFVRVRRSAGELQADGIVHLAKVLDEADEAFLASLGIPEGTNGLEIEGLTAQGQALLLGLKSPLDIQGRAMIWRLGRPDALLDDGDLAAADLTLWARVPLTAGGDGVDVPAGISELLLLPNGVLLIASTPSSGDPKRVDGRLWFDVHPGEGILAPKLLRTFPGRKPEGLSLTPSPGKFIVAFDAGDETPSWTELPWPR